LVHFKPIRRRNQVLELNPRASRFVLRATWELLDFEMRHGRGTNGDAPLIFQPVLLRQMRLPWPKTLRRTPQRFEMHARLSALPPGLSNRQVAEKLKLSMAEAYRLCHAFGYRLHLVKPSLQTAYAGVDWTLPDSAIARQLNRSRQAIGLALDGNWVLGLSRLRDQLEVLKRQRTPTDTRYSLIGGPYFFTQGHSW